MPHSPAYLRFLDSMKLDYERWHDGIPFDLEALANLEGDEREEIQDLLISTKDNDWRVSDALACLKTPLSVAALVQSTRGPNREVRVRASEHLYELGELTDLDDVIVEGLTNGTFGKGLQETLWLAAKHPSPKVTDALLAGALCRRNEAAVHCVALLFFLRGLADEEFDMAQRDYFLLFRTTEEGPERRRLFDEMCARIGVDGSVIHC